MILEESDGFWKFLEEFGFIVSVVDISMCCFHHIFHTSPSIFISSHLPSSDPHTCISYPFVVDIFFVMDFIL